MCRHPIRIHVLSNIAGMLQKKKSKKKNEIPIVTIKPPTFYALYEIFCQNNLFNNRNMEILSQEAHLGIRQFEPTILKIQDISIKFIFSVILMKKRDNVHINP